MIKELYGIKEAIFLKMNDLDITACCDEKSKVTFFVDTEQERYDDIAMDYMNAVSDFRDITCSYTKYLKSEKWVKNMIYNFKNK